MVRNIFSKDNGSNSMTQLLFMYMCKQLNSEKKNVQLVLILVLKFRKTICNCLFKDFRQNFGENE